MIFTILRWHAWGMVFGVGLLAAAGVLALWDRGKGD